MLISLYVDIIKTLNMSLQGSITTADFLDFDTTMSKAKKNLKSEKEYKIAFLTILGLNLGLRISDLLQLKHKDLLGDELVLTEKKTKKRRILRVNDNVKAAYTVFICRLKAYSEDDYLFLSQKKTVYTIKHVNRLLKQHYGIRGKRISSHSLRKSFGRRVWENDHYSERALIMLSRLFNHTNIATTKIYLGIQQQELNDIYTNL